MNAALATTPVPPTAPPPVLKTDKKSVWAWCFYDWANSAFSTVIMTFVFSVYFSKGIVGDEIAGSALWGYAIGTAGLCVAIGGPILGVMLDARGHHGRALWVLTIVTTAAIAGLFWMLPDPAYIWPALALVAIATIGFELGQVVYNALLPRVASAQDMGRVSGRAWGLGYVGGLVCLAVALGVFIGIPGVAPPLLALGEVDQIHVRATCLLTAGWFFVFALPLLLSRCVRRDCTVYDIPERSVMAASVIMAAVMAALLRLKDFRNIMRFLIASALYRDGLATLFAVGGLYAAGSFGMDFSQILMFGIGLNVTAGIGSFAFAVMDDKRGSKVTIVIGLLALIGFGVAIVLVQDKIWFVVITLALGVFVGPVQAASRTLLARISPPEHMSEMFGLYALTGKSIAFLGPFFFAVVTDLFDSQRAGVATIIMFWAVGLLLLRGVREETEDPKDAPENGRRKGAAA